MSSFDDMTEAEKMELSRKFYAEETIYYRVHRAAERAASVPFLQVHNVTFVEQGDRPHEFYGAPLWVRLYPQRLMYVIYSGEHPIWEIGDRDLRRNAIGGRDPFAGQPRKLAYILDWSTYEFPDSFPDELRAYHNQSFLQDEDQK